MQPVIPTPEMHDDYIAKHFTLDPATHQPSNEASPDQNAIPSPPAKLRGIAAIIAPGPPDNDPCGFGGLKSYQEYRLANQRAFHKTVELDAVEPLSVIPTVTYEAPVVATAPGQNEIPIHQPTEGPVPEAPNTILSRILPLVAVAAFSWFILK